MKAYILIGMVGSGKSSWARMIAGTDFNTIRVGVDDIRGMIKGVYTFDYQLEPLVDKMKVAMIKEVLLAKKDVVVDDCHLTKNCREKLCLEIKKAGPGIKIIYVWIRCDTTVALRRRLDNLRGRSEFEWKQVMLKHMDMFDTPTKDENIYVSSIIEVCNE